MLIPSLQKTPPNKRQSPQVQFLCEKIHVCDLHSRPGHGIHRVCSMTQCIWNFFLGGGVSIRGMQALLGVCVCVCTCVCEVALHGLSDDDRLPGL